MLRLSIDINGRQICTFGVWNSGRIRQREDTLQHRYVVYDLLDAEEGDTIHDVPEIGELWHDQAEGGEELARKTLERFGDYLK